MVAKIIPLVNESSVAIMNQAEREIEVLSQLDHSNVIRVYDSFIEANHYFLIFEECVYGSLKDAIENKIIIREMNLTHICYQLLCALQYCHSNNIAHRDIKPSSILLDENRKPKLSNFGISILMKEGSICEKYSSSVAYLAPEILRNNHYDPFKADIWALGIVYYQLLIGKVPWKSQNVVDLVNEIKQVDFIEFPSNISDAWRSLLSKMLMKEPSKRPTAIELLNEPIFSRIITTTARKSSCTNIYKSKHKNLLCLPHTRSLKIIKSSHNLTKTFQVEASL